MTDIADRADLAERAARAGGAVAEGFFRRDLDVEVKDGKTDVVTRADHDAQRQVVAAIRDEYEEDAIVGEESVVRSTTGASGERERATSGASGSDSRAGRAREASDPRATDELKQVPAEGPAWVIDPVDGTNNYVRDIPLWVTSVAAVRDGEAVAAANVAPVLGDVYTADADGAYLNGDPVTVSDRTDPETFAVTPTIWWELDRRDEYAAACREVVERFADLRRFGSAQYVLSLVASGGLDGAVTNVDANPWDTVAGAFMVEQAGGTVTGLDGERWTHASDGLVASNGELHGEFLDAARSIRP